MTRNEITHGSGILFHASLEYGGITKIRSLDQEAHDALRAKFPAGRLPDKAGAYGGDISGSWICDIDEAKVWSDEGFSLNISKIRGVSYPVRPADAVRDALAGNAGPTMISISVANAGLYDVQSVRYEEDCCTNELGALLREGWRLLAVCPPNDARRPTYILGHRDPNANR